MTLRQRLRQVRQHIDTLDEFAIDTLSRATTWLAPLVPAIMVYHSAQQYIEGVDRWQALAMATVIELLGLSVVSNWLNVAEFNRQYEKERVRVRWHVLMVVCYAATVLAIVVGLKIAPAAFSWLAIVMLSLLSFWSAVAFVLRRQHSERLEDKLAEKEARAGDKEFDRQLARATRLAEHERRLSLLRQGPDKGDDMSRHVNDMSQPLSPAARQAAMLDALQSAHAVDYEALAAQFGVSSRTVRRDVENLIGAGRLSVNGKVTVLG